MFFYASKILSFIITPIVWIVALLLFAVFSKNSKRTRRSLIAATVLLIFFSNSAILDEAMRLWEIPATKDSQIHKTYDVGIVLGGMTYYDPQFKRIQFRRSSDRLFQALRLYHEGIIKKIFVVSGSGSILHSNILEAPLVKTYLLQIGVPDSAIMVEGKSKNTHENAAFAKPILEKEAPGGKYLLITSAFHMRRSIACFKKEGITVDPYSTDRYSGPMKYEFDYLFMPDSGTFHDWDVLIHEWVGYVCYWLAGYV